MEEECHRLKSSLGATIIVTNASGQYETRSVLGNDWLDVPDNRMHLRKLNGNDRSLTVTRKNCKIAKTIHIELMDTGLEEKV